MDMTVNAFTGALARLGDLSWDALTHLFETGTLKLRQAVIRSLVWIEGEGVIQLFIKALASEDNLIRVYAAYGLGYLCGQKKHKDDQAVAALIQVLQERPISSVLADITLWSLATISTIEALSYSIGYLQRLPEAEYRGTIFHIIGGLGLGGNPIAVSYLIPFLNAQDSYKPLTETYLTEATGLDVEGCSGGA
jgi:HEAT repeat protein